MHLILSKDKEEIRRTLDHFLREISGPILFFSAENFSQELFFQEVETYPFLSKSKVIVIQELEQFSAEQLQALSAYIEKPSQWVELFLTASELASQTKLVQQVEKKGKVRRFNEEKPWEKEKRLIEWLVQEAQREQLSFSTQAAAALVREGNSQWLRQELDKLICFVYGRKEITLQDVALISTASHHETLWQLGDALLMLATSKALTIGAILLEEGIVLIALLASLRAQYMMGIELLSGESKKFSYLKGNLLDKKLQMFKNYGKGSLQRGLLFLFDAEIKAKSSAADPALLLELLIIRLTHDVIPSSQSSRTC